MKTENEIIERFKRIFRSSRLSKSEFAAALGIDHQSLNKYLTGVYDIQKISIKLNKLGYSVDWLYSGEGLPTVGNKLTESQTNALLNFNILEQKYRIKIWIEFNYENVIEFEISRNFKRHEIQIILDNSEYIPYLIQKRIENAGCNIYWTMTGIGTSYADNDCGNELREKNEN